MLRLGVISELGTGENLGFCRVFFDEVNMVSGWLPLPSVGTKKGGVQCWKSIEVNSQVACLMDNRCEQGCIVAVLWSNTDTPPEWATDKIVGIQFADGAKIYFDHEAHKLIVEAPDTEIEMTCKKLNIKGEVSIEGETSISGDTSVSGEVSVDGDVSTTGKLDATGNITSKGTVEGVEVQNALQTKLTSHIHSTAVGPTSPPTPGT